ncbi:MAG TPA: alpha/beta hydrolase [Vicinamibacterales bacterium]|nr:alpha/beta hydrolase [Vicinamibacterales bacterium]
MRVGGFTCILLAAASTAAAQPDLVDRTFEVNGLSLHIRCGGQRAVGAPLVVLEAGANNSADTWRDVHGPISQFARACAWDRPGRGSSASPAKVLAPTDYVPLLAGLLKAANEPGPYVLVGHSIGGIIGGLFANAYASDVAGMVLVDSSHEAQIRRFQEINASRPATSPAAAPTPPPTAGPVEPLPVRGLIDLLATQPWRANIPLVVLTRGQTPPSAPEHMAAVWLELQRDLATRSPQGKQIIAANSGHYIHNDEPHLVIDAVRTVITAAAPGK